MKFTTSTLLSHMLHVFGKYLPSRFSNDRRQTMVTGYTGLGMVCGKDMTRYYQKAKFTNQREVSMDASADRTKLGTILKHH
jgi:hypothetical protein